MEIAYVRKKSKEEDLLSVCEAIGATLSSEPTREGISVFFYSWTFPAMDYDAQRVLTALRIRFCPYNKRIFPTEKDYKLYQRTI